MIKAVIFDMDGVLVNSERIHYKANIHALKKFGIHLSLEDYKNNGTGKGTRTLYKFLSKKFKKRLVFSQVHPHKQKKLDELFSQIKPIPFARESVNLLSKHYKLGLASASLRYLIKDSLKTTKIPNKFKVIQSGADVTRNKPFPDVYLETARKLRVKPEFCIAIEDSEPGIVSAKRAGMKVIAVPNSFTKSMNFSRADKVVKSLKQITPKLIDSL